MGVCGSFSAARRMCGAAHWYNCRMSEAIAFDTHRFVKHLTEAGFTERQAETLAEEQVTLLNANLATKSDVARIEAGVEVLRQETKSDIARLEAGIEALRQETKSDIARLEAGIEALRQETKAEIEGLRQETKAGIEGLRQETKAEIEGLRQETKAEIEGLRQETKAGIEGLRQETKAQIEASKVSLIKWMFAALVAQTTITLAVISMLLT